MSIDWRMRMRISADVIIMVCHYYGGKDLIKRIEDVILTVDVVFDTYPQVVAKLKEYTVNDEQHIGDIF